jgi:tetratricopeptide (TPR) repeat protein
MKLENIFPAKEQVNDLRNIESALLTRKKNGKIAGWVALLSAFIQMLIILYPYLQQILDSSYEFQITQYLNDPKKLLPVIGIGIGTLIYLLLRRTSFLLKETKEPFRYTCWVEPFSVVKDTPGDRFNLKAGDRFNLLHHDLIELINQRIKRFSFIEMPPDKSENDGASVTDLRKSSHIHIYGHYAIREDKNNNEWIIHVMPYVRIGSQGSPATMAQSVRFPLSTDDSPDELDTYEYNQLLERVYSRVTTEIYAQIEKDIQGKIELFPTSFLQANALYYEASDMANSNTINAFESAILLYEEAIRKINLTLIKRISNYFLNFPFFRTLFVRNVFQNARIQIGHARCLVYKNRIAALSGKKRNPVFEIRQDLKEVINQLEYFHSCLGGNAANSEFKKENEKTFSILAYLTFPNDTWLRRLLLKPSKRFFDETRVILFNAYVVHSLTDSLLGAFLSAQKYIDKAKAIAPDRSGSDPLYILAQAYIEPNIDKALFLFQQVTDKDSSFQIAQYDLAFWTEMKFRLNDEINHSRARIALQEYDKVLRINPGNIAALAAQGYIYWLLHDLDKARRKFEEGCELKTMVSETFIGQLLYGRARILVEQGKISESYDLFNQAFASNPNVGTFSIGDNSWMHYSFYEFITPQLRNRFEEYYTRLSFYKTEHVFPISSVSTEFVITLDKGNLSDGLLTALKEAGITLENDQPEIRTDEKSKKWKLTNGKSDMLYLLHSGDEIQVCIKPDVSEKIADAVFSYVLNDYGNANFNFYKRYGDLNDLDEVINNYSEAITSFPQNTIAKYNKSLALVSRNENIESIELLDDVIKNNPNWFEALASSVEITLPKINEEIKLKEDEIRKLKEEKTEMMGKGLRSNSNFSVQSAASQTQTKLFEGQPFDPKLKEIDQKITSLRGIIEEQQNKKKELWPKIRNILKPTKLISLYDGLQLQQLNSTKIDQFIGKKIYWTRLDDDDVRALRIYAISFYYDLAKTPDDIERQQSCKRLFDHLLNFYYPEDYTINLYKKELLGMIGGNQEEHKKRCDEIIESNITYWLEQDPICYNFLDLAKTYLSRESYFNYLETAIQLEISPDLLDLILTGDYYKERGLNRFIEIFESSTDLNSKPANKANIYNRLANLFANEQMEVKAISYYEKAIKYDNSKPIYLCNLGLSYFNLGRWNEAIDCYQRAIELRRITPDDPRGLEYYYDFLSEASIKIGNLDTFLKNFESSGDLNSEPGKKAIIYNRIGNLYFNSKQAGEAIPFYTKAIELDNERPIYYSNKGLMYSTLGQWEEALRFHQTALELRKLKPNDSTGLDYYYDYLSEAYFNLGKIDEFLKTFNETGDLDHDPEIKAIIFNRIGNLNFTAQQYDDAIPFYTQAVELDNARPIYSCNLGLCHSKLGQWDLAIRYYQQAIERRRKVPNDYYGLDYYYDFLSEAYFKISKLNKFTEIFESSGDFKNEPEKKAIVYNRIGNLFFNTIQFNEAISFYKKAITLDPDRPIYHCNLGLSISKSGQWDDAMIHYQKAITLRNNSINDPYGLDYYYEFLAEAYFHTDRLNEFIEQFEATGDLNQEPEKKAIIYNRIGNLYADKQQEKEAIPFYTKAIELDPLRPIYYSNMGLMYSNLGQFDEGLKFHQKALEERNQVPNDPYEVSYYQNLLSDTQSKMGGGG